MLFLYHFYTNNILYAQEWSVGKAAKAAALDPTAEGFQNEKFSIYTNLSLKKLIMWRDAYLNICFRRKNILTVLGPVQYTSRWQHHSC